MTDLRELIARVERADGPDRELDDAIGREVGRSMPLHVVAGHSDGCWVRRMPDGGLVEIGSHNDSGTSSGDFYLPRYTASVDAAMSLVPEGWRLIKLTQCSYAPGGIWQAELWSRLPAAGNTGICAAKHPALALCLAALRAREADDG